MTINPTKHYNLSRPTFNEMSWHDDVNGNMTVIDALMKSFGITPVSSVWLIETAYVIGDRTIDPDDGTVWEAEVDHTSGSGTFAADRAAHPTYWSSVATGVVIRGQFVTGQDYLVGDLVYDTTEQLGGVVIDAFTGGANLRVHIADLDVIYDLEADWGGLIHAAPNKATPVDADEVGIWDSVTGFLNRVNFGALRARIFSLFGAQIAAGTLKASIGDSDKLVIADSAAADATKYVTWAGIKAVLVATIQTWTAKQTFQNAEFTTAAVNVSVGQIQFPASQNASAGANTLDDYEEGTYTAGISINAGTTGITYDYRFGRYTKVGNTVHVSGIVTLTSKGALTGQVRLTGLPFATPNVTNQFTAVTVPYAGSMASLVGGVGGFISPNTTDVNLVAHTTTGEATLTDVNLTNTSQIMYHTSYFV